MNRSRSNGRVFYLSLLLLCLSGISFALEEPCVWIAITPELADYWSFYTYDWTPIPFESTIHMHTSCEPPVGGILAIEMENWSAPLEVLDVTGGACEVLSATVTPDLILIELSAKDGVDLHNTYVSPVCTIVFMATESVDYCILRISDEISNLVSDMGERVTIAWSPTVDYAPAGAFETVGGRLWAFGDLPYNVRHLPDG